MSQLGDKFYTFELINSGDFSSAMISFFQERKGRRSLVQKSLPRQVPWWRRPSGRLTSLLPRVLRKAGQSVRKSVRYRPTDNTERDSLNT